jgi:hypothetical protein
MYVCVCVCVCVYTHTYVKSYSNNLFRQRFKSWHILSRPFFLFSLLDFLFHSLDNMNKVFISTKQFSFWRGIENKGDKIAPQ